MKYKLVRNITKEECSWLDRNFREGEVVHRYSDHTYNCISPDGIACSIDGKTPFFELPADALELVKK